MSVEITWVAHSTVEVRNAQGLCLVIDPWYSKSPVAKAAAPEHPGFALVTHDHWDHVQDVPAFAKSGAKIVTQPETLARLSREEGVAEDAFLTMNLGGTRRLADGVEVTMIPALHTSRSGLASGYIVKVDGFTFAHLGDTALFSDLGLYGEMYAIDLAMVPIGDHFTMGPGAAARAVTYLGARLALPLHYGTFPALVPTAEPFVEALRRERQGAECWVPEIGGRRTF
jgi:L-ascorbate metabolism protein UlaG (beta-lactamase superfamily)